VYLVKGSESACEAFANFDFEHVGEICGALPNFFGTGSSSIPDSKYQDKRFVTMVDRDCRPVLEADLVGELIAIVAFVGERRAGANGWPSNSPGRRCLRSDLLSPGARNPDRGERYAAERPATPPPMITMAAFCVGGVFKGVARSRI